jgi:hypothetical protein
VYAGIFGISGLVSGLAFFAPVEQEQGALAPVIGACILLGTGLFTINWLLIGRFCVWDSGIIKADWLGFVRQDVPFQALSRVDLGTRPSVPTPARVVEIQIHDEVFILDRRIWGDAGLRALLRSILQNYPAAPFSEEVREYIELSP